MASLKQGLKIAQRLPKEALATRYEIWRKNNFLPEHTILVVEATYPPDDLSRPTVVQAPPLPPPDPTPLELITNFTTATTKWVVNGFPTLTKDQYHVRADICNSCEFWDPLARMGLGKCQKCGCAGLKRWLATEACPDHRWPEINPGP